MDNCYILKITFFFFFRTKVELKWKRGFNDFISDQGFEENSDNSGIFNDEVGWDLEEEKEIINGRNGVGGNGKLIIGVGSLPTL